MCGAATGPSGWWRRRWWLAVAVGYALHLAWRLWLARAATVPAAHVDEDGYLLIARALAGGPGGYTNENGPFLRVGFPLLLSPIYLGGGDAFEIYHRAVVLDAFIGALLMPLAAVFARRVVGLPPRWAVGAAMVVAALPAVVFYAGTVLTDAVLPTLAMAWLVLLHGGISAGPGRGRWAYAVGCGGVAGLTYTVHVRGTMILLVHCLVAAVLLVVHRIGRRPAFCSLVAAVAVAGIDPLAKWVLGDAVVVLGDDPQSQITTALTADWRVALILLRVLGQAWYLAIGTLGLGLVGVLVAAHPLVSTTRRRRLLARPAGVAGLVTVSAALAVTVLIAVGSATSLPFGEHRITYFVYPRYLHFLFPVWFLIGFGALRAATPRARLALAASTAVLVGFAAAVVRWRTEQATGYLFIPFDVPEMLALSGQWRSFTVLAPTVVALGVFAALAVALSRARTAVPALAVVAGLCAVVAPVAQRAILGPMVEVQYRPDTPQLVRDLHLGRGDVVAEAYQVAFPFVFNHAREVSWHRLLLFDVAQPPPAEATVVIAPWYPGGAGPSWPGGSFGLRLIGADAYHGWAVWRRD